MKGTIVAALLLITSVAVADAQFHRVPGAVKERYIVLLHKDTPADVHADAYARAVNARIVHLYTPRPGSAINGFSMEATEPAAQAMTKRSGVASVWEVPVVRATDVQTAPPHDLDRIDQRDLSLDGSYTYTLFTTPTTIYIADTGVDPRFDFGNRLTININFSSVNGIRDPNNYTDHGLPLNDIWHGTATAAIAAGTNYGVAKFANIANVRVLSGNSTGTYDDVVAGIRWITDRASALPAERHVANASFAGAPYAPAETAFRESVAAGVAWVFAAGNVSGNGAVSCNNSPARLGVELSGAITVGAMIPETDVVDADSSQGTCVEVFAPTNVAWARPRTPAARLLAVPRPRPHTSRAYLRFAWLGRLERTQNRRASSKAPPLRIDSLDSRRGRRICSSFPSCRSGAPAARRSC